MSLPMPNKQGNTPMSDELKTKLANIFLVNGAVTIEETESEGFMQSIEDVVALFEKQIQGVRDATGQTT